MLKTISLVALAALAVACCVSAVSFVKNPIELPSYRLPTDVKPVLYDIHLNLTSPPGHPYKGKVFITVVFGARSTGGSFKEFLNKYTCNLLDGQEEPRSPTKMRTNQIVMHADDSLTISSIKVSKQVDDHAMEALTIVKTGQDKEKQLIALTMDRDLPQSGTMGLIVIEFEGWLRTDMRGIYISSYDAGREKTYQIVARFQPTFARLALPCFDEPAFKARFGLTLTYSKLDQAYATMPMFPGSVMHNSKYISSRFDTTPRMSIHMLTFILGRFNSLPMYDPRVLDRSLVHIVTPLGRAEAGAYALQVALECIKWFESETDSKFPLEKLDLVAIPDTDSDNTETWGLASVRDNLLLVDKETKPDSRIATALNVAYVVAHQWFGSLITAKWWSDLWITESIAAHMAFEFVASRFPQYQSDYFVRISTLSRIVQSDSSGKKHALSPPENELTTSSEISELFDNIQFMKSGALARLIQETLGPKHFRGALRSLVSKNAHSNVGFDDLVEELRSLPTWKEQYEDILWSWSTLKSYPLINAVLDETGIHLVLYQEPYPTARKEVIPNSAISSLQSGPAQNVWNLPLRVLFSDRTGEQKKIETAMLGPGDSVQVDLPEWFVPGEHWLKVSPYPTLSTYYRVRYSDKLLQQLKWSIEQKQVGPKDRLHLLDDANALFSSGLIKNDTFKEMLGWYANEDDFGVIMELLIALRTMSTLEVSDSKHSLISQVAMKLYESHRFNVSGSETLLEQRAREITLNALIAQGVQQVIQDGVKAFAESEYGKVALFLREPVYAAVVAGGTEEQVELLFANLQITTSFEEKVRLARALALSKDISILNGLKMCLNMFSSFKDKEKHPIEQLIAQTQNSLSST